MARGPRCQQLRDCVVCGQHPPRPVRLLLTRDLSSPSKGVRAQNKSIPAAGAKIKTRPGPKPVSQRGHLRTQGEIEAEATCSGAQRHLPPAVVTAGGQGACRCLGGAGRRRLAGSRAGQELGGHPVPWPEGLGAARLGMPEHPISPSPLLWEVAGGSVTRMHRAQARWARGGGMCQQSCGRVWAPWPTARAGRWGSQSQPSSQPRHLLTRATLTAPHVGHTHTPSRGHTHTPSRGLTRRHPLAHVSRRVQLVSTRGPGGVPHAEARRAQHSGLARARPSQADPPDPGHMVRNGSFCPDRYGSKAS